MQKRISGSRCDPSMDRFMFIIIFRWKVVILAMLNLEKQRCGNRTNLGDGQSCKSNRMELGNAVPEFIF